MSLNKLMSQDVAAVLEESTAYVTNRLIMESLQKTGNVSIQEAQFMEKLATEVIMEAAEDFIPEAIEVPDEVAQAQIQESAQYAQAQESAQPAQAQELTESEAIVNNLINKML